ncbi:monofunctional biosynthetic peptidoglycan transglycosylase [Lysobacter sp. HDW10]|uniref:monofunctional biosynthetic peptidoglycan transglycosylase n=1 Tax=Lysobacter sp. HDW10 TaxID=2714936 RepID=UPI00140A693A|nr:monofunctional biosynthetic peptidoglycan transglycosylase [Lysobacter sp. HDW10]QIK82104.1 monofunctional biosynthetic peptidoglycan transglycosylase [Lysobacter sp. HDW10]
MSSNGDDVPQSQAANSRKTRKSRPWFKRLVTLALAAVLFSVLQVASLRFINPPFSSFMAIRMIEAWTSGDFSFRLKHEWVGRSQMSAAIPLAMIASEDQKFADHGGFDLEAIEKAQARNARGKKIRGGSTITQQTAKNLFLWGGRNYVRKGLEAWYTVLMEVLLPKARIIELYANFAEFGDGIYGVQAASRTFYGVDAKRVSVSQAARLAAVLPSPRRYSVSKPGPYVQRRARAIERQMRMIGGQGYLHKIED